MRLGLFMNANELPAPYDFGRGFWAQDRKATGKSIDVLRGQNIPHNSRTIDRTVGIDTIVSHKSTDLRLKSYRSPQAVYRLGMGFVKQLASYKGEVRQDHKKKATYYLHWMLDDPGTVRILEWFLPCTGVADEIEVALQRVALEARSCGVTVLLLRILD